MSNLLFLAHRLPFPPNKGDKVRSYHLLKHLSRNHRVFVGTFVDEAEDEAYVDEVKALCVELCAVRLHPRLATARSMTALFTRKALTVQYYCDSRLQAWVDTIVHEQRIDATFVFSSAMAQYVADARDVPMLVDFVDVDSAKWLQDASTRHWALAWIYRREGRCLLEFERAMAKIAQRSFFATEAEAGLFRELAPESRDRVDGVSDGVDSAYFSPDAERLSPFSAGEIPIVFTGAMDYWPNVDAAQWFAGEVLPRLRQRFPIARFYIVGRKPAASIKALAGAAVTVTGTVADVRPYLQHAATVVAPLRIARGVQNKVLEAMSMGCAVVASSACAAPLHHVTERELATAIEADDYVNTLADILCAPERRMRMGTAARNLVRARYSWAANLSRIDAYVPATRPLLGRTPAAQAAR